MIAMSLPNWLTGPAVAAAIAALSFLAKLIADEVALIRSRRAKELTRLVQLEALLDASRAAYLTQVELRERLLDSLRNRVESKFDINRGAEWNFDNHFDDFTDDELALHKVIRSYTEHAIRPLNVKMLEWLDVDNDFRSGGAKGHSAELSEMLRRLQPHLLLWLAKYEVWIPANPSHALVYLADEERHGVGFPRGIEDVVRSTIGRYRVGGLFNRDGSGTCSDP